MNDPISTCYSWIGMVLTDLTKTILLNQLTASAPRPAQPYAILHLEGAKSIGQSPVIMTTDEDGVTYQADDTTEPRYLRTIQRSLMPKRGVIAVELVGAGSLARAQALEDSLSDPDVLALFADAGIGIALAAGATDSPDLRDTTWEPGASVGFSVRWMDVTETEVDVLDATQTTVDLTEAEE